MFLNFDVFCYFLEVSFSDKNETEQLISAWSMRNFKLGGRRLSPGSSSWFFIAKKGSPGFHAF